MGNKTINNVTVSINVRILADFDMVLTIIFLSVSFVNVGINICLFLDDK